jgi:hypothetical protein
VDINIPAMVVGREHERGPAIMLVPVDNPVPAETLDRIRSVQGLESARVVRI